MITMQEMPDSCHAGARQFGLISDRGQEKAGRHTVADTIKTGYFDTWLIRRVSNRIP